MKFQMVREIEAATPLKDGLDIRHMDKTDSDFAPTLRQYLIDFTMGILDPDIADKDPARFIQNLQSGRLGDFSEADIAVAHVDGAPAGLSLIMPDNAGVHHIYSLHVAPRYRRLGVGAGLLADCLNTIFVQGGRRVILDVHESNIPAIKLYQSMGFTTIS